jgi:lactoylglutathione lyase
MRILHTMIRVGNLEKSVLFYTEVLGMTLFSRQDYPEGRFTLAFVGFGDEKDQPAIELTHNWDTERYDLGTGFGHIAIDVGDVYLAVERIREAGGRIVREAGPMKFGSTLIAFVEDPDGYKIELLGKKQ